MKITWTCSVLFDFGFHVYSHVIPLLSQLECFCPHKLCETAFTVCLKRKKQSSWVLWFAVKKVSYQPVKVFCWPKEILQMFWPSFRCWFFPKPKFLPKPKMISNVFINCWVTHCQPLPSSFSSESLSCFCQIKLPSFHMCHSTSSASIVPQGTTFFLPFLSWPTVTVLVNSAQM